MHLFPSECENCWSSLPEVPDALAQRYQQIELPPLSPHVKAWQRHAVACPGCGHSTRAAYDERKIPASPFGPRLMALMALLTGVYHLSRRKATQLLGDVVGVSVSLCALSAVEARVSGAVEYFIQSRLRGDTIRRWATRLPHNSCLSRLYTSEARGKAPC